MTRWRPPLFTFDFVQAITIEPEKATGDARCGRRQQCPPHDHSTSLATPRGLVGSVNEATFRLNEGNCEIDTIDRMKSFAEGIHGKRLSYDELRAPNGLSADVLSVR